MLDDRRIRAAVARFQGCYRQLDARRDPELDPVAAGRQPVAIEERADIVRRTVERAEKIVESLSEAREEPRNIREILYTLFKEVLPESDRKLLEQRYFEGLSLAEIAQENKISKHAVKQRLFVAINKLTQAAKDHITGEEGDLGSGWWSPG